MAIETFRHTINRNTMHMAHAAGGGKSIVDKSEVVEGEERGGGSEGDISDDGG